MATSRSTSQRVPAIVLGVLLLIVGVMLTGFWSTDGKSTISVVGGVAALVAGLALIRIYWRR